MMHFELMDDDGILVVTPEGPLSEQDFRAVAATVDPYIEKYGALNGLMILAESFPGWEGFAGLVAHIRFVRDHHKTIARVAAVTDSGIVGMLPTIAQHFVAAQIRHFDYKDKQAALSWLRGQGG